MIYFKDKARLSWITIVYGIYIVASASFMLQVNLWLNNLFGSAFLIRVFWLVIFFIILASVIFAIKARVGIVRILSLFLIFLSGYIISTCPRYFEEKTHLVMYAILGYLLSRDLIEANNRFNFKSLGIVILMAAIVSACDELFQWILPYRFGEFGDFILNLSGAFLGIALFFTFNKIRYIDRV